MSIVSKAYHWLKWHLLGGKQRAAAFALQRDMNQQHRYDYPAENNGWHKLTENPVAGNIDTGSLYDPQVVEHDGELLMSVSERRTGSIIMMHSDDGIRLQKKCTILAPRKHCWEHAVNRSCLQYVNGLWHLWYTGQHNNRSAIGHLVSESYMHFERPIGNKPVLRAEMPLEGEAVMNPFVLWNGQLHKFQMWYAAGENYEPDRLFYAESPDGNIWVKHPMPVLEKAPTHPWEQYKVGGCEVALLQEGTYIMYYIGYQNVDVARICYAISTDGIHWNRTDDNLCLSPTPNAWDSDAVYKPSCLMYKGKKYLWYNGRSGNQEYIGLAVHE